MSENTGYTRKKEPEAVRRALLDSAVRIAATQGYGSVTLQTVANAANVTKGGLLHHFPTKHALVEGMFHELMAKLDETISDLMEADTTSHGRFTRAYVNAIFDQKKFGADSTWSAMASSVTADPAIRQIWSRWLGEKLEHHAGTDGGFDLELVRLAADGAWYAYIADSEGKADVQALHDRLIALTEITVPKHATV